MDSVEYFVSVIKLLSPFTNAMHVLCAIAVVEWLGINEISLITSALALAFGAYLVSIPYFFSSFNFKVHHTMCF